MHQKARCGGLIRHLLLTKHMLAEQLVVFVLQFAGAVT